MNLDTRVRPGESPAAIDRSRRARRGLAIYFAVLIPLSIALEVAIIASGDFVTLVPVLMLVPALSSVVARLVLREGFGDVSFRLGGRWGARAILVALLFPVVVGAIAYGIAWAIGLAQFEVPAVGVVAALDSPAARFAVALLAGLTIVTLVQFPFAATEEIGWRGFMLTRLIDARVPNPILVSGLIWGLWHLPLILSGQYASGPSAVVSAALFMVSVTSVAYLLAWLRLSTGSVWPAVVGHASWNAVILNVFDPATAGAQKGLWTGESGILVALALVVAAIIVTRRSWTMLRRPGEPMDGGSALRTRELAGDSGVSSEWRDRRAS